MGVGALAGSTIMLLTIPWFLSIVGGRVNIDPVTKMPNYKCPKLDPPDRFSLTGTGVALAATVNTGSVVMLVTSVTYLLLQVPGLVLYHATPAEQAEGEKNWAAAGTFLCVLLFGCYLGYQYHLSKKGLYSSTECSLKL